MKKIISMAAAALALSACQQTQQPAEPQIGLTPEAFGEATVAQKPVKLYTIENKNGMKAQFTNLGAKLVTLYVADKNGKFDDVVLGYATAAEYAACDNKEGKGEPFFGATIGRYGNRIANHSFEIDGQKYELNINEKGVTTLHGGHEGFYSKPWDVVKQDSNLIAFHYVSPDGEMGFPGNLDVTLTYELTNDNALTLTYEATTDKPTIVNLTNHSFFNLKGEGNETVNDHLIQILGDNITPVDSLLIPTGEFMPVEGTAFDFRTPRAIGDSLTSQHPQMLLGNGYDHNWVLSSEPDSLTGLRTAAVVTEKTTGRVMTVLTTEPGVQFYEGNFLNATQTGKRGVKYPFRSALCLETQHFPNSPNIANFPTTILRPGEKYFTKTAYAFSIEK